MLTSSHHFYRLRLYSSTSHHFYRLRKYITASHHFYRLRLYSFTSHHFYRLRIYITTSYHFYRLRLYSTTSHHYYRLRLYSSTSHHFFLLPTILYYQPSVFSASADTLLPPITSFHLRHNYYETSLHSASSFLITTIPPFFPPSIPVYYNTNVHSSSSLCRYYRLRRCSLISAFKYTDACSLDTGRIKTRPTKEELMMKKG